MNSFIWSVIIGISISVFFLAAATIVAFVARERGRSVVGFFFLALFFSFIVAILTLMALPSKPSAIDKNQNTSISPQLPLNQNVLKPNTLEKSEKGKNHFKFDLKSLVIVILLGLLVIVSAIGLLLPNAISADKQNQEKYSWTYAVANCGATSDYKINGKTIELFNNMSTETKVCILSQFSEAAAAEISKNPNSLGISEGQVFSKEFSDGFLNLKGVWNFNSPFGSGRWTIAS